MFEKEVEEWADKMYPCDGQAQQYLIMGAEFGYNKGKKEMVNVIKLLISTLDITTWREDPDSPCCSGSETFYNCPDCSCKDCYRVACEYNKSEIFKQLYQDFPELYK